MGLEQLLLIYYRYGDYICSDSIDNCKLQLLHADLSFNKSHGDSVDILLNFKLIFNTKQSLFRMILRYMILKA